MTLHHSLSPNVSLFPVLSNAQHDLLTQSMKKRTLLQQRELVRNPQGPMSREEGERTRVKNESEEKEMMEVSARKGDRILRWQLGNPWLHLPLGNRPSRYEVTLGGSPFPWQPLQKPSPPPQF